MPYDIDTLRDLLELVQAATGPDADLDQRLCAVFFGAASSRESRIDDEFTGSIDGALGLLRLALPGWVVELSIGRIDNPLAAWAQLTRPRGECHHGEARQTPPLAILTTLLQALIAQAGASDAA